MNQIPPLDTLMGLSFWSVFVLVSKIVLSYVLIVFLLAVGAAIVLALGAVLLDWYTDPTR